MAETQLLILWIAVLLNLAMVNGKEQGNATEHEGMPGSSVSNASVSGPTAMPKKWMDSLLSSTAAPRHSPAAGNQQQKNTSVTFQMGEATAGHPTSSPQVTVSSPSHSDASTSKISLSSHSENQDQVSGISEKTTSHAVTFLAPTQHKDFNTESFYSDPPSVKPTSVSHDSTQLTTHEAPNLTTGSDVSTHTSSNSSSLVPYFHPGSSDSISNSASSTTLSTVSTNSSKGALIPRMMPKGSSVGPASGTTKTPTAVAKEDDASGDTGNNPCSTSTTRRDGLVSQCLIAIASLAAVATIFLVSTIVLCTKLSAYKHRYKIIKNQGTEMVCISSLLPDGEVSQGRPRIPKSNGALIPSGDDSEGDDLTLHSFLPENDRNA